MTSLKAARAAERERALDELREVFPVGSVIYTVSRKPARGVAHTFSFLAAGADPDGRPVVRNVSWLVAKAGIFPLARDVMACRVSGDSTEAAYNVAQLMYGPKTGPEYPVSWSFLA